MLVTSGIGVAIQVTLHACSRIVGQGTAFPFDAAFLGCVGGLTGAKVQTPRQATGTDSTTIVSAEDLVRISKDKLTLDHNILTSLLVALAVATDSDG